MDATEAKPRIGFIGLGLMGHGMAKNIVAKGFPLTVRAHRNRKPLEDLLAAGAKEVATNAEVARASDIVFLCVTGTPQVEAVVYEADGLLGAARAGLVVVDTSTAEPASTAAIRADFQAKQAEFVDAPLARTPKEAEEGRLNIMVGAEDAVFARLKPVLAAFCENIIHAGPARARPHAEADQQLRRDVDRHRHRRGRGDGGEGGRVAAEAARGDLRRRGQLGHLPDDARQDAAGRATCRDSSSRWPTR